MRSFNLARISIYKDGESIFSVFSGWSLVMPGGLISQRVKIPTAGYLLLTVALLCCKTRHCCGDAVLSGGSERKPYSQTQANRL